MLEKIKQIRSDVNGKDLNDDDDDDRFVVASSEDGFIQ